ncbi:FG-GAP repeat domain-containing protein [Rubrivirga sp. IMCC43871]|uniref:FG-GAP repeat domain-containing protein n=1 Tax=Rubrivirga sp. IMCC43871 TaxID=3391575 RepID=UPI0039902E02
MRRLLPTALALAGCFSTTPVTESLFDPVEVVLGVAGRPTVLTEFLTGGPMADLAVVTVGPDGEREVQLFAFGDSTWTAGRRVALGADVAFVDVVQIGGRERLVVGGARELRAVDFETGDQRPLAALADALPGLREGGIPHADVSHDLTGDGRDDVVVPTAEGWAVAVQTDDGFAEPLTVGSAPDLRRIAGADGHRLDPWPQARVWATDADGDGRPDLVAADGPRLLVHRQDASGQFEAAAETLAVDIDAPDDTARLGDGVGRVRAIHTVADLTDDGVPDLLVLALDGSRGEARTRVDFHRGTAAGGALAFAPDPTQSLGSDGRVQIALDTPDLDGDGAPDLVITSIERRFLTGSWWKRLKGSMGDDVWLTIELVRAVDGRLVEATTRRLALDGPPSPREPGWVPLEVVLRGGTHAVQPDPRWARAFDTFTRVGDVTGDGRPDLLIGDHPSRLSVHRGTGGPALFADPVDVPVRLPGDGEYAWLADLNGDDRLDVVLHHPFWERDAHGGRLRPPGTEPHQLTLLLAR